MLVSIDTGNPKGLFGLFRCEKEHPIEAEYSILVEADGVIPDGFCEVQIPKATWAVFDCKGPVPQAIQRGWKYLSDEWLVNYPFPHAPFPELEWYSDGNA